MADDSSLAGRDAAPREPQPAGAQPRGARVAANGELVERLDQLIAESREQTTLLRTALFAAVADP